jgi:hypothetical protein
VKGKFIAEMRDTILRGGGGDKEYRFDGRFPGFARSSFRQGRMKVKTLECLKLVA